MLNEFININGSMTIIKLNNNDELAAVETTRLNTHNDSIIYTNKGNGIRRDINEFTVTKPNSKGTKQLVMSEDEFVIGISKIDPSHKYLLFVTSKGNAKITDMKYLPNMKRKEDIITLTNLDKKDSLIGISAISLSNEITFYRKNNKSVTISAKNIPILTRIAKAEKIVKTPKGDSVLSYEIL